MAAVRNTCIEMLQQRGYTIISDNEDGIVAQKDKTKIITFFNESTKLDVERVKEYISLMVEFGIDHSIIVVKDAVTPVARKVIDELPQNLNHSNFLIELFEEKSLRYNITKHRLVPKHTSLSRSESIKFKHTYGTKIPVLLKSDAIVRFYNFQRGDIIEVERSDGFINYRIVR